MGKRLISLALIAAFVAVPAVTQAKRSRTASGEYNTLVIAPDEGSPGADGHISNGVEFKTRTGERFVSVALEDKSGMPVRAVVSQDMDGDGVFEKTLAEICGASTSPIKFRSGLNVLVSAQEFPCDDSESRPATFGTVTATFTR